MAALFLSLLLLPVSAFAGEYQDQENGSRAVVEDSANLFTDGEEAKLLDQLKELLSYGNMGIVTNEEFNSDAAAFARTRYLEIFGETNGTIFLIDMYNRRIQIFSGGSLYRTIPEAKANEITDNVYTYASSGNYYQTASKAFEQIKICLEGGVVVAPMRLATNAAFAIGIVLLINFIIITSQRKKKAATTLTNALVHSRNVPSGTVVKNVRTVLRKQSRKKHVESSGGGFIGGGGGGGFSGGGGGGGFSGGGGGHSF